MSRCNFCGRQFQNTQAVKAHLRTCSIYQNSKDGDAARPRIQSSLNHPESVHRRPLTPNEAPKSSDPFVSYLDQLTQQFAGPDETARVKQKREALLADLCTRLVDWYYPLEGVITPEMAAAAKVGIIEKLSTLPIDDMPQSELTLRGTVIRNRIFAPYLCQQKEEKDRQLTQHKEEHLRSQQDTARQARRTTRKAVLIELGISRALKAGSSQGLPARALSLLEGGGTRTAGCPASG